MDDVTNDSTNGVTIGDTNGVTNDVTDDQTRTRNISEIIVNCCQLNRTRNFIHEMAFIVAFDTLEVHATEQGHIGDISGSCAEFNIVPAVLCVGDIDMMFFTRDHIVLCDGYVVGSLEAKETTAVYTINTSACPNGYVYLMGSGRLQFNWNKEQFEFFKSNDTLSLLYAPYVERSMCQGPAQVGTVVLQMFSTIDIVLCVRIIGWPPVARSWISRERKYAWPSNAIVSEVQRKGCDLVHVSHRDYKHNLLQWRYSFSRAEVTLIRSWTPIQQIIYHLLRYVAKRTIIREWKDDDKVICTYNLKTLMFWACERKSPAWWESNCVLDLCSKLLDTLMKWIKKRSCPHYFIPEWNLFDCTMKESRCNDTIETLRNIANIRHLTEWFRINYVSKIFNFVFNNTILGRVKINYMTRQLALDINAASNQFDQNFHKILRDWVVEANGNNLTVLPDVAMLDHYHRSHWNTSQYSLLLSSMKLESCQTLGSDLQFLNLALVSLRLAWNISRKKESELSNHELLDVLSGVVLKLSGHDICNSRTPIKIPFRQCSKWYFIKGVRLLSTYCKKHSAAYCLWVKTCKRYFKSALRIRDEYSASIHDACHVYLSALYYVSETSSEKVIKYCMEATKGGSFNNFLEPYILDYSTLLFVDMVAHVCGFCFLFGYVSRNQEAMPIKGFSLTAIVSCLIAMLRTTNTIPPIKIDQMEKWKLNLASPCDRYLWTVSAFKYRRKNETENPKLYKCSSSIRSSLANDGDKILVILEDSLEEILIKTSVEMFTKYYELKISTVVTMGFPCQCKIVSHFQALYYYRKGEYDKLLNTCNSIISREIFRFSTRERNHSKFLLGYPYQVWYLHCVSVMFAFQALFRHDVICLTGLIALIDRRLLRVGGHSNKLLDILKHDEDRSLFYLKMNQGKLKECQMISTWAKVSCRFLVYYLRCQSLYKLNYPKSDILSALDDLKHASSGFVFEDILVIISIFVANHSSTTSAGSSIVKNTTIAKILLPPEVVFL